MQQSAEPRGTPLIGGDCKMSVRHIEVPPMTEEIYTVYIFVLFKVYIYFSDWWFSPRAWTGGIEAKCWADKLRL